MALQTTPENLRTGILVLDTNDDDLTGFIVPLRTGNLRKVCKLQINCDGTEEIKVVRDLITAQPVATPNGDYAIEIRLYDSNEDRLVTFPNLYSVDALLACVSLLDQEDMGLIWLDGKRLDT